MKTCPYESSRTVDGRELRVDLITDRASLESITDEWRGLASESLPSTPFALPEWTSAWLDVYAEEGIRLVAVASRRDSQLVGFLPMVLRRGGLRDGFFRYVEPPNAAATDYFVPLLRTGHEDALAHMLDALADAAKSGVVLILPNLPSNSPIIDILDSYFRRKGWPLAFEHGFCPQIELAGDYGQLEKTLEKRTRADVRRQRNRLSQIGDLSLEIVVDRGAVDTWLEEFFDVYGAKWSAEKKPDRLASARVRRHYQGLIDKLWNRNVLHLSSVKLDDVRISYHFGFLCNGWLSWYTPTYRKEFAAYSPSKVHVSMLLERGCADNWTGFDFLQGREPYKLQWTKQYAATTSLIVGLRGAKLGHWWRSTGLALAKRWLRKPYERSAHILERLRRVAK